jgi:hypothetical protein
LADNFDTYKKLRAEGKTPEEAAAGTFTGKMATRSGFTKVTVVSETDNHVVAEFTRDE